MKFFGLRRDFTCKIIEKAKAMGASLAGIVSVSSLRDSPSYTVYGKVKWPKRAKSIIIMALSHEVANPEIDWWDIGEGGTPGNRKLETISESLIKWLDRELKIDGSLLPYHLGKGGIFLKDAAVLAGLGIIGRNNLVITPDYGPRVRFRAIILDKNVPPTEPISFTPCATCDMPCIKACPQDALKPGPYNRKLCDRQMKTDENNRVVLEGTQNHDLPGFCIKYCRLCELACPIGL